MSTITARCQLSTYFFEAKFSGTNYFHLTPKIFSCLMAPGYAINCVGCEVKSDVTSQGKVQSVKFSNRGCDEVVVEDFASTRWLPEVSSDAVSSVCCTYLFRILSGA